VRPSNGRKYITAQSSHLIIEGDPRFTATETRRVISRGVVIRVS
jgi:hypothetical protein